MAPRTLPAAIIAACAMDRAIGRAGRLPWRLPADWAFFCAATRAQVLVVGRRSFQEFDGPLPGRRTIVVSQSEEFARTTRARWPDVRVARGLPEALALAGADPLYSECSRVFVGGGQRLFEEAMTCAAVDLCYVSRVHRWVRGGDAFFPEWTRHFPTLRYCASVSSAAPAPRCAAPPCVHLANAPLTVVVLSVSFQVWAR